MNKITGKLVAGLIGFFTLGIVGLLFGIAIGHAFDRYGRRFRRQAPIILPAAKSSSLIQHLHCWVMLQNLTVGSVRLKLHRPKRCFASYGLTPRKEVLRYNTFVTGPSPDLIPRPRLVPLLQELANVTRCNKLYLLSLRVWLWPTVSWPNLNERRCIILPVCSGCRHRLSIAWWQCWWHSRGSTPVGRADKIWEPRHRVIV